METVDTSARLEALRTLMNEHNIDIYSLYIWPNRPLRSRHCRC